MQTHGTAPGSENVFRGLIIALASVLIAMNAGRMLHVPLTVDESPSRADLLLTYWDYISMQKVTANIHILNSVLRKASVDMFGNTPFALRLPSLLAQLLFLYYLVRLLVRLFVRSVPALLVFIAINANPFLFEFWSYSRGYALAIAFLIAALYHYCAFSRDTRSADVYWSLLFAVLSVWSNFSLLNFYLALILVFLARAALPGKKLRFRHQLLWPIAAGTAVLAAIVAVPIAKLRAAGELYYGGENGLVRDTITSLARDSLYVPVSDIPVVRAAIASGIALNAAAVLFYAACILRKRLLPQHTAGLSICLLLNFLLVSLWLQHQLLGTKYLVDRTAMFLLPLFYLNTACLIMSVCGRKRALGASLIGVFALLGVVKFAGSMTVHKSRAWWMDNYNVEVLKRLAPRAADYGRPLRLRVAWIQMPSMDYYVYTRYSSAFEPLDYDKLPPGAGDTGYDYLYLPCADTAGVSTVYRIDTVYDGNFVVFRKDR